MNRTLLILVAGNLTFLHSAESALVEAENSGAGTTVEAEGASGGKAATASAAWLPLMRMPAPPATLGAEVCLWVRRQGGPLQCKGLVDDGTQHEFAWSYDKASTWTWTRFGPFASDPLLAKGAIVIRSDKDPAPLIDVAVWTTTAAPQPVLPGK